MEQLLIIFICLIISALAQSLITKAYNKYSQVECSANLSGKDIAERFLRDSGIYGISIQMAPGNLTDHYDPANRVIRLSRNVYFGTSVSSVAIACHEVGHAIQHANNYSLLVLRNKMIPVVKIANTLTWLFLFIGLILSWFDLIAIGVGMFAIIALFQLITLPIELNASRRANKYLNEYIITDNYEMAGAKKVLRSAAFTYLAALLVSILQIGRFAILLTGGRRR